MLRRTPSQMYTLIAAALLTVAAPAFAQKPPQQIDGATLLNGDPVESSKYLGSVYKNEPDGFKLAPPAGSRIVQRSGVDLVSFIVDAKSWGGSLQRLSFTGKLPTALDDLANGAGAADRNKSDDPMTMGELLAQIKAQLPKSFKGVQVLREQPLSFDGKDAVRFDVSMEAELGTPTGDYAADHTMAGANKPAKPGQPHAAGADVTVGLFRQQLIIETEKDKDGKGVQFLFLTLYAPLKDRDAATRTFEAMLPEFVLYDPKQTVDRRVKAVKAGREWLKAKPAEELLKKLNNQPQYFLLQVDQKTIGFIQLDEQSKMRGAGGSEVDMERSDRKGILMTVKFGSFADAQINYGQIDEFWAFSHDARGNELGQYSEWNIITKSQIKDPLPPGKVAPGGLTYRLLTPWRQETGNISADTPTQRPRIIVTFGGDTKEALPTGVNRVVPEGNTPEPLPKVLEYAWPRLVDVTKPSEMSFITYDSRNNKLALRNLIVTGQLEAIKVNGKPMAAYKLIDEIDPNNTTLWVNKDGQIQLMKTSDQSIMQPTTIDTINRLWPSRPSE